MVNNDCPFYVIIRKGVEKMEKIKPRTLSGFMELLPTDQIIFNKMIKVLEEVYELYGFFPLDTPILESSEVLLAKAGGETEKQIYRFSKGTTDLTMRFDLTVPLAKYVAKNYNELVFPFKRYQIGKVYRGERAQKGRFREFYQADIDIIGDGELNIVNDAEIPSIIYHLFKNIGLTDFTIHINNRKILSGFFKMLDLVNKTDEIMRIIDKKEKIKETAFLRELIKLNLTEEQCYQIIRFINIKGKNEEVLIKLKELMGNNKLFDQGVNDLEMVYQTLTNFNLPSKNIQLDLSIARGLDYYTGTVYETRLNKHPEIGSICSGGRYDDLAEYYIDKKLPGVGISIGLTRLFFILKENNYLDKINNAPADVLIIPLTQEITTAISISNLFRKEGLKTLIYFEDKKIKNKISYAHRNKIKYALFLGEDEIKNDVVTLKELESGFQATIILEEALFEIKESIKRSKHQILIDEKDQI